MDTNWTRYFDIVVDYDIESHNYFHGVFIKNTHIQVGETFKNAFEAVDFAKEKTIEMDRYIDETILG